MLFSCEDISLGEIPHDWELQWVSYNEYRYHGRPPMISFVSLSYFSLFFETWFVINKPLCVDLDLNCVM
jgi:hypothetical protein